LFRDIEMRTKLNIKRLLRKLELFLEELWRVIYIYTIETLDLEEKERKRK